MKYWKQDDFDDFRCIAGACPESCCAGWQIFIDQESLEKYRAFPGPFGERLRGSIDWEQGRFLQDGPRCLMLNGEGLCDLQTAGGEQSLCQTCARFPRHMEEYEDVREYSLSLSCPQAAKMTVERSAPLSFTVTEDQTEDDPEDYEDFDDLLYDLLCTARDLLYKTAEEKRLPLQLRLDLIMQTAGQLQDCYDRDHFFDMDHVLEAAGKQLDRLAAAAGDPAQIEIICAAGGLDRESLEDAVRDFQLLYHMEMIHPDWISVLNRTGEAVLTDEDAWQAAMDPDAETERAAENILISLLYTYFCGAVYDGQIRAKAAMAVYSLRWVLMVTAMYRQEEPGAGYMQLMEKALWQYARQVEHSDQNLDAVDIWFGEAPL